MTMCFGESIDEDEENRRRIARMRVMREKLTEEFCSGCGHALIAHFTGECSLANCGCPYKQADD